MFRSLLVQKEGPARASGKTWGGSMSPKESLPTRLGWAIGFFVGTPSAVAGSFGKNLGKKKDDRNKEKIIDNQFGSRH